MSNFFLNKSKQTIKYSHDFIARIIRPRAKEENRNRQEFILNILLLSSIIFLSLINIIRIIDVVNNPHDRGLPLIFTLLILVFFLGLYYLSRRGHLKLSAVLLILVYSLPTLYFAYHWGTDLPAVLLLAVLIIIMSGILIGSYLAFINTLVISGCLLFFTYLQQNKIINVSSYWRLEANETGDMISYIIILSIISLVAWLYAHEIEKSLKRARLSETALKIERDLLEVKVIERTKQIRSLEMEKITQLYRLAEFGRLSSGIFHDLINPLTAVALNLEELKKTSPGNNSNNFLEQAFKATRRMENFIISIKKQIQGNNIKKYFILSDEIEETRQILNYKIQKAQVELNINIPKNLSIYGDPLKFSQVIANLLSNAVEACEENPASRAKKIYVKAWRENKQTIIKVSDNGIGIKPELRDKIWETFFSTKNNASSGLGIGLASTKNIIEKDFFGTITTDNSCENGTAFKIVIPPTK